MSFYKNYGGIRRNDQINAPYRKHTWEKLQSEAIQVPDNKNTKGNVHFGKTKWLAYMTYDRNTNKIYVTDRNERVIKTFERDLNAVIREVRVGDSIKYYNDIGQNPGGLLEKPVAICSNSIGHLFVGDHVKNAIFVFKINQFDENGKDIENFEMITAIQHDDIKTPSSMVIEDDGVNRFILYVTDWFNSKLTVWQLDYEPAAEKYRTNLIGKTNVVGPSSVRVSRSNIAVISEVSWEWKTEGHQVAPGERLINKVTQGLNAIYIFDKSTLEEKRIINLDNYFNPRGLYIDKDSNIYITAYMLSDRPNIPEPDFEEYKKRYYGFDQSNRNQFTANFHAERYKGRTVSKSMYLVIMNMNGDVLQATNLGIEFIIDFLVFDQRNNDNKIAFMSGRGDPAFNLIEFDELEDQMDE